MLWNQWWNLVCKLRSACARTRTFLWMSLCLAGFSTRKDLQGVTSIVRALGLKPACYDRLLDFFHSPALDLDKLTRAWCALVFRLDPGILSTADPSSSATASKSPRPDARCPESKSSINNPSQTTRPSTSSATPAKRSRRSPKPCPAYLPCLWPVASTKAPCFPTATIEPCWTR